MLLGSALACEDSFDRQGRVFSHQAVAVTDGAAEKEPLRGIEIVSE